ncbi:UNVERIFIED_CONTAM: hypothetical protein FKN15_030184 [Acipenser sinensis]
MGSGYEEMPCKGFWDNQRSGGSGAPRAVDGSATEDGASSPRAKVACWTPKQRAHWGQGVPLQGRTAPSLGPAALKAHHYPAGSTAGSIVGVLERGWRFDYSVIHYNGVPSFLPNLECPIIVFYPGSPLQPPGDSGNRGWNTRPPKRVPANLSFFALRIHSKATRPIVLEDNTDLNGSTADPQVPYQPQGSLVRGEPWIPLPT